jgi:dynein heavy chain
MDEFNVNKLTNDKLQKFYEFLQKPDYIKFFVWLNEKLDVELSYDSAPKFFELNISAEQYQVAFFIKRSGKDDITMQQIEDQIITGKINNNPLDDLLVKMTHDFVPKLHAEQEWPDGVKKEFQANLNKFMATLTEESATMKGKTQLYIPEEHISDIDTANRDKDLVQRLESTVIYWTRQIKEVVSNQETQNSQESSSPLDEIEHWRSRSQNLMALKTRLQEPKLKRIIEVLQRANSSYLTGFKELEEKINTGYDEAADNLTCLSILQAPCKAIDAAEPKGIPKLLPEVLNNVRMIWECSKHYNTNEKMKSLLTKISNQIIQRCRAKINKDDMYGANVEKCIADLDECIECCNQFREISKKMQRMIETYSFKGKDQDFGKEDTIFAENEAFIQRCRDLKEICEGQLQFALAKMPKFGGTKGKEWKGALEDLKDMFEKHLKMIQKLSYDILDVKITQWHEDYGQTFKEEVKQIEIIYTTIIALTFKHVSTLEDAVEMLENFYLLARRPAVMDYV